MNNIEREYHVKRILSGIHICRIDKKIYLVHNPNSLISYKAEQIYNKIYKRYSFLLPTHNHVLRLLIIKGMWTDRDELELENIPKQLDDLKVALFKAALDLKRRESLKKNIKYLDNYLDKLYEQKHSLDRCTAESLALGFKARFLIAMCTKDEEGNSIFTENDFWKYDNKIIDNLVQQCGSQKLSSKDLRFLARSSPWRNMWSLSKTRMIDQSPSSWSPEQSTMVLFSKIYDGAYENPDFPGEELFEDDDMFDGWMIFEKRKREKERTTVKVNNLLGKNAGATEIFIPANNSKFAQEINDMNDITAKIVKAQREKVIQHNGTVAEEHLPDNQQALRQMASQQFRESVKRK